MNTLPPQPSRRLLSIVVPCHNERAVLAMTFARLNEVGEDLQADGLDCEWLFINDGSTDATGRLLDEQAVLDARVRVVHLTRNFGHQAAVSAGLEQAAGDAVAVMDADLQDPPEVLHDLVAAWRAGNQVVYAVRRKRKEGPIKRLGYWAFYRALRLVSDLDIPADAGDFCLMDRSAVDLINRLPERQRFVRGLRSWVGLKQVGVPYERSARQAGTPSYNLRALIRLASDGLVSFSVAPLRLTIKLGLLGVVLSFSLGLWVIASVLMKADTPHGWASLACLVLLLSSIQLICLGILGEYMARIFLEVKGRPTYLVASITQQETVAAQEDTTMRPTLTPTIAITEPIARPRNEPKRIAG